MAGLGKRLKSARKSRGLTQGDVAKKTGLSIGTISGYERDYREPDNDIQVALANIYGVSVEYLINGTSGLNSSDIRAIGIMVNIPIVAEIPCGEPIFTSDSILGYMPMDKSIVPGISESDYVWLKAKGDSMTPSNITDGCLVLIRLQPEVENGEIAAVCIDNENATLKRVLYAGRMVILQPSNPSYKAQEYALKQIRIVGKVVKILSDPI